MVPVPKKGDLRDCNKSRGISLLEVTGKVFARVMMSRLQRLGEESVFEESQAGFRALGGRWIWCFPVVSWWRR